MAAKVFTIAQQKGGAGKTTLAVNLAVAWADRKRKVALVDIDPQGSLGQWYALRRKTFGDNDTGLTQVSVTGWRASGEVEKLARTHDIVIVDSPPHAETEARIAVRAAGIVIVPVQPSPMDLWATRPTLELARAEKRPVVMVLNRVPARSNLADAMYEELAEFDVRIAENQIGNRVAYAAALVDGRGVTEYAPSSPAAEEIADLAKELLRKT